MHKTTLEQRTAASVAIHALYTHPVPLDRRNVASGASCTLAGAQSAVDGAR